MSTENETAVQACQSLLESFFAKFPNLRVQVETDCILKIILAHEIPLPGKPCGWAGGILYAVSNKGRWPCGVLGLLNKEIEEFFGVSMSTIYKRAAVISRLLIFWSAKNVMMRHWKLLIIRLVVHNSNFCVYPDVDWRNFCILSAGRNARLKIPPGSSTRRAFSGFPIKGYFIGLPDWIKSLLKLKTNSIVLIVCLLSWFSFILSFAVGFLVAIFTWCSVSYKGYTE